MDRSVSLLDVLAWSLWVGGGLALAYDVALGLHALGHIGVVACCAGATLHVKGFVESLREREMSAFELGRDSVRNLRR